MPDNACHRVWCKTNVCLFSQIKKEKKNPTAGRCTKNISALLESASVFLLLEKGVCVTKHSHIAETAEYLASVTGQLLLVETMSGQEFLMK